MVIRYRKPRIITDDKQTFPDWRTFRVSVLAYDFFRPADCSDLINAARQGKTFDGYGLGFWTGIKGSLDKQTYISKAEQRPITTALATDAAHQQRAYEAQQRELQRIKQKQADEEWERRGEEIAAEQQRSLEMAKKRILLQKNAGLMAVLKELKLVGIKPTVAQGKTHIKVRWPSPDGQTRLYIVSNSTNHHCAEYDCRAGVRRILRADGLIVDSSTPPLSHNERRHRKNRKQRKNRGKIRHFFENNTAKKGEVA
jgi:hypothetical protein